MARWLGDGGSGKVANDLGRNLRITDGDPKTLDKVLGVALSCQFKKVVDRVGDDPFGQLRVGLKRSA